jgi:hypothetical protein
MTDFPVPFGRLQPPAGVAGLLHSRSLLRKHAAEAIGAHSSMARASMRKTCACTTPVGTVWRVKNLDRLAARMRHFDTFMNILFIYK